MARLIKDPSGLTFDDLQNNDWDVIELNITVDTTAAMEWVTAVQQHRDCIWAWSDADPYVDDEKLEYFRNVRNTQLIRTEPEPTFFNQNAYHTGYRFKSFL